MFVRVFADGGLIIIILLAGAAGLYWIVSTKPKLQLLAPYVIMAGLTSLLVGKLMSLLPVQGVRPFVEQGTQAGAAFINNPGFPSDHALLATVVIAAVFFVTRYKKLTYVLIAVGLCMAVARVFALVHTPFDIFGGVAAGLIGVMWYYKHKKNTFANS